MIRPSLVTSTDKDVVAIGKSPYEEPYNCSTEPYRILNVEEDYIVIHRQWILKSMSIDL